MNGGGSGSIAYARLARLADCIRRDFGFEPARPYRFRHNKCALYVPKVGLALVFAFSRDTV
jgi:hypothetical protein